MPQDMRAFFINGRYKGQVFFHHIVHIAGVQLVTFFVHQQELMVNFGEGLLFIADVAADDRPQFIAHRYHPFLIALAKHFYMAVMPVEMAILQLYQFGKTDARMIEYLQDQPFGVALPVVCKFYMTEKQLDIFFVDELRQPFGCFGIADHRHGTGGQVLLFDMVFKKRLEGRYLPVDGLGNIVIILLQLCQPAAYKGRFYIGQRRRIVLRSQEVPEIPEIRFVGNDGMLTVPFLEFKVLKKFSNMSFKALGHKKTDNQS